MLALKSVHNLRSLACSQQIIKGCLLNSNGRLFSQLGSGRNVSSSPGNEDADNLGSGSRSAVLNASRSGDFSVEQKKVTADSTGHPRVPCYSNPYSPKLVDSLLQEMNQDMPLPDMPDPFAKDYPRCFLCRENVKLDHKNVRLLSQFVSPYTGRIYGRAITGLCIPMQKQVAKYIKRARISGFMPFVFKDPRYFKDPQPYDPMRKN